MTVALTPSVSFTPVAREYTDTARPFVSLWVADDVLIQVPLTPEGREWLHGLADAARWATVPGQWNGVGT